MIHSFEEYALHYDKGNVMVDFGNSDIVGRARKHGWRLRYFRSKKDFLRHCRQNQEKFELAYRAWGADFHPKS